MVVLKRAYLSQSATRYIITPQGSDQVLETIRIAQDGTWYLGKASVTGFSCPAVAFNAMCDAEGYNAVAGYTVLAHSKNAPPTNINPELPCLKPTFQSAQKELSNAGSQYGRDRVLQSSLVVYNPDAQRTFACDSNELVRAQ